MTWIWLIPLLAIVAIASRIIYRRITKRTRLGNDDTYERYVERLTARINTFYRTKLRRGRGSGRSDPAHLRRDARYSGWEGPASASSRPMLHATRWRSRLGFWHACFHFVIGGLLISLGTGAVVFGVNPDAWSSKISKKDRPHAHAVEGGVPSSRAGPVFQLKKSGLERFRDWYKACDHPESGCRIYTVSEAAPGPSRYKLLEVTPGNDVLFTALIRNHDLPAYVEIDKLGYMRADSFFETEQTGSIAIDGMHVGDLVGGDSDQLRVPDDQFGKVVRSLERGREVVITYSPSFDDSVKAVFSAMGFSRAYQALHTNHTPTM